MTKQECAIIMAHTGICMLTGEEFKEFHKEKPDISQDDFAEVVAYMHGKVLSERLELTPSEKHEVMNRLMSMIMDEVVASQME